MMIKNFLKLSKKRVDRIERRLARFISAQQFLWIETADDNELWQFAAAWPTKPTYESDSLKRLVFEETESQKRAREIMGQNFMGIAAVHRHFGDFTPKELKARNEVRLKNEVTGEFFSEEETLAILEECKDTHILVATIPLNLPEIHARFKERFTYGEDCPFFSYQPELEKWSSVQVATLWLLVRKTPVPESGEKEIESQKEHLLQTLPNERMILPGEYVFAALLFLLETGQKICDEHIISFAVQTVYGSWVDCHWMNDQLHVNSWRGFACPNVFSGSVRNS